MNQPPRDSFARNCHAPAPDDVAHSRRRRRSAFPLLFTVALLFIGGAFGAVAATVNAQNSTPAGAVNGFGAIVSTSTAETSNSTEGSGQGAGSHGESGSHTTSIEESDGATTQHAAALAENPLNIAGNGAVTTACELPEFGTDVAAQDAFYQAALPCLMDAWQPALEDADLPTTPPDVLTTGTDVDSPCGARPWDQTAMYCPANHTIYMNARYYAEIEGQSEPGVFLGQFAHEFGHAVQGLSGISRAYNDVSDEPDDPALEDELSRRSELQATCFGGMSMAALQNGGLREDYVSAALRDARDRGDEQGGPERTHGSLRSNETWLKNGFYSNRTTECNTWEADSTAVG